MANIANRHTLHRTSPKGTPFVGTCPLCGRTGLTISDINDECDNPRRLSRSDALLEAINPPKERTPTDEYGATGFDADGRAEG